MNVPLPAGSRENQLMFSYYVDVNMAGGQVEIRLPSGWTIHTAAENIFPKDQDADTDASNIATDAYGRYGTANSWLKSKKDFPPLPANSVSPKQYTSLNRDGKNVDLGAEDDARDGAALDR